MVLLFYFIHSIEQAWKSAIRITPPLYACAVTHPVCLYMVRWFLQRSVGYIIFWTLFKYSVFMVYSTLKFSLRVLIFKPDYRNYLVYLEISEHEYILEMKLLCLHS